MNSLGVDLFVEDHAQLKFLRAVVERIATETGCKLSIQERSAMGGHARVKKEIGIYQQAVGTKGIRTPDVLVIGWDANCKGRDAYCEIEGMLKEPFKSLAVIACPEPHIERWYMIDPVAFAQVVGPPPAITKLKCDKSAYKRMLAQAAVDGGQVVTLGGIEFAREIVAVLDWYKAGKADGPFKVFIDDLRKAFQRCMQQKQP